MPITVQPLDKGAALDVMTALLEDTAGVTPDGALVSVGDAIDVDVDQGYLRGHGTMVQEDDEEGALVATVSGAIQRVNRLIFVKSFNGRYTAELGDVVVGRVVEIAGRRWAVDVGAATRATLQLGAVALPGNVQRRRTADDELLMRDLFREGDVIVAEQVHKKDQSIALNMRGSKFRKLRRGTVVTVPASCIRRKASHFVDIADKGVRIVTGCNGWLWIGATDMQAAADAAAAPPRPFGAVAGGEAVAERDFDVTPAQWTAAAAYANAAQALAQLRLPVFSAALRAVVQYAELRGASCRDMLGMDFLTGVITLEEEKRTEEGAPAAMDVQ